MPGMAPSIPLDPAVLRRSFPELRLLLLHGSRARGEAHANSDWDFAYLADPGLDELDLRAALAQALKTDAIDVVDLERAGAVLRYGAARDGIPVLESTPGRFQGFCLEAIRFWLEIEPILARSHRDLLERLG